MNVTKAVRLQLGALLAADPTTLAPAMNGNKVVLVNAPFTWNENMVIGDFSQATFTGSTPKTLGTGAQNVGVDPPTQQQVIQLLSPAGGLRWICTVAPGSPETIYGAIVTDNGIATLIAGGLLDKPRTITNVGDQIILDDILLNLVLIPIS